MIQERKRADVKRLLMRGSLSGTVKETVLVPTAGSAGPAGSAGSAGPADRRGFQEVGRSSS